MSKSMLDLMMEGAPSQGESQAGGSMLDLLGLEGEAPSAKRNAFAYANDFAIDAGNAAAGLVKSGVDLVAPGSAPSKAIGEFIKEGESKQSDWKQQSRKRLQDSLKNADGELAKAGAYIKHATTEDPLEVVAQGLGNMGPFRILGMLGWSGKAASALSAGLSAGEVRGNIYDKVQQMSDADLESNNKEYADLRASGISEEEAKHEIGSKLLKHLPELAGVAAVGALGGKYGLEAMASGKNIAKNRLASGAISMGDEAVEGAAEQLATNVGVRRSDPNQPLMEDVALNAVQEGMPGAIAGVAGHHSAPAGVQPSASRTLIDQAFADVKGAGEAIEQQRGLRGKIAYSLAAMDEADRANAINKIAAGDEALAQKLHAAAQDQELVALGKDSDWMDDAGTGSIDINEMIRKDAGLIEDEAAQPPTAVQVADAVTQQLPTEPGPTNSAGYIPEPLPQLQAQVQAVREGRKPGAFMGVQEAKQVDLNGLQYAEAVDPNTGESGVFIAADPSVLEQAVSLTQEIGLREAAGKVLGYVNPTLTNQPINGAAVVQQIDQNNGQILKEEAVQPHEAGNITRVPGTTLNFTSPQQALAQRAEQAAQAESGLNLSPDPAAAALSFHGGKRAPLSVGEIASAPSERSKKLVARLNQGYGLQGDAAVAEDSVHEVQPSGDLRKIARAMKWATGTDVVFVKTPKGAAMRANGEAFQSISGVADPEANAIYVNVDTATPLGTVGHEVVHVMEQQVPELYAKLEDVVFSRLRAGRARQLRAALTSAMQQENGASGHEVTTMLRKELVAEAIGELAQDPKLWNDVFQQVGQDRGLGERLAELVHKVLSRIKTAFTREGYTTGMRDMEAARRAFQTAYSQWAAKHAATPKAETIPETIQKAPAEEKKPKEPPKAETIPETVAKPLPKPKALTPEGFPITLDDNDPLLQPTIQKNNPDRILLRLGIIAKHFALRKPSQDPILITLGGGGGVGKTTVLKVLQADGKMPGDDKLVKVNADDIKEMLPEYEQIKRAGDWRAAMTVHEESSLLVKAIQARALGKSAEDVEDALKPYVPAKAKGRYDILIDATMSEVGKGLKLLTEATERGFDVRMVAVVADPAAAIDRAKKRGAGSGRYVPTEVLAKAHAGFLKAVDQYSHVVREFHLWDNQMRPAKAVSLKEHHEALETYRGSAEKLAAKHQPGEGGSEQAGSGPDNRPDTVRPDPQAERGAGEGAGQEQSQNELAGGVTPEAPPQPAGPVPEGATSAVDRPVAEYPVSKLTLSAEVPQFKEGADASGVTADAKLHGKFDRRLAPPIAVWERTDGRAEVISGRHRLDLARRSGETTIPAQVYREAEGFTSEHARLLDIELNVKDGRGKVKDYVAYFQERKSLTEQEARADGLLNTAIGRSAYRIAHEGTAALVAAHKNGAITDQGAVEVAHAAPGSESLQAVGLKYLLDGKPIQFAVNMMRAAQAMGVKADDSTGDLFGHDDTALKEAEAIAKEAGKQQAAIRKEITAVRGAAANPELARKNGVEVLDPEETKRKIAELEHRLNALERFQTSDELIRELRIAAGLQTKPKSIPELRAALEATEPLTMEHVKALDALRDAMHADAQQAMDKGEMPVYRNSAGTMVVTITPSAQNPGKLQLTRYINDRGIVGDSQYNNLDDLMRQEGLTNWERVEGEAAEKALAPALHAQAEYEARRAEGEALLKAPTPEEVVAKQEAEAEAKKAEARKEIVVVNSRRVKGDMEGTWTELTLSNGEKVNIQRMNSTESMGVPGWHDISTERSGHSGPGSGYLADTQAEAIKEVLRRKNEEAQRKEAADKKAAQDRELQERVQKSVDGFQLGQNADDAVSGQGALLSRNWLASVRKLPGTHKDVPSGIRPAQLYDHTPGVLITNSGLTKRVPVIIEARIAKKLQQGKIGERGERGRSPMSDADILELPKLLEHPAAIFKSVSDGAPEGSIVVLTTKVMDGEPLLIALHPSKDAQAFYVDDYLRDPAQANRMASAHPRDFVSIKGWTERRDTLLRYYDPNQPLPGLYQSFLDAYTAKNPVRGPKKQAAPLGGRSASAAATTGPDSLGAIPRGAEPAQRPTSPPSVEEPRKSGNTLTLRKKPDVPLQRNATKATSVAEALQMTATGKMPYDLGDALERHQWADAYMLAKDPNERKSLMRKLLDKVIEVAADALIPVKRWIDALPLNPMLKQRLSGNLYRAATLRAGMEKEVSDTFTRPLFDAVAKAAKATGMTTDQVKTLAGWWMTAKYAPKANALLISKDRAALRAAQASGNAALIQEAQRNLQDRLAAVNAAIGGARNRGVAGGMNDAEAAQMVRNVEGKIDPAMLKEIAKPIYGMMQWRKAKDIASGRVSQAMVNSWPNHADYVPLTGDPRATREDHDLFNVGNHLNQDAEKAMNGRKDSVADNGIDAAVAATVRSINHAAIQEFKQTLMKAYTDATRAGIDIGVTVEPVTGIMRNSDDVIIYRDTFTTPLGFQEQRAYAFKFKDDAVIGALKKDAMETVPSSLEKIGSFTRMYGRAVTQLSVAFAPINMVRDIWERSELLRTRSLYDRNGNKVDVSKAARASIADTINPEVWRATFAKSFKTGKQFPVRGDLEEMIRLGGNSVWGDYLSRQAGDLEAEMRRHAKWYTPAAIKADHLIEGYNNTFEMVPALSIYRALKAQNMEPKDAAAAVLDLMNFKKRGTAMPVVRTLYVFAQPAATSAYNLAQYLSTRRGQVRFAAQIAIGSLLYAGLRGMWGDDDDEELGNRLDNLSNFTVERSIPLEIGGKVVKVPVGFGPPQLAWVTAATLNRWQSGRYSTGDALGELGKSWVKTIAPVAPSDIEVAKRPVDWLIQTLTPTAAKPIMQIGQDITGMGGQLTPMFKDPNKLKALQANRTTPAIYSEIAQEIQSMTGVDLYPDHIKALVQGYGVGPVRELLTMWVDNPAKDARGEPGRIPVLGSIVDNINDRAILNSVYYRVRDDIADANRKYSTDPERYEELRDAAMAFKQFESREKVLQGMRSALKKAAPNMDEDTLAERTQAIEERSDALHRELLKGYLGSR